MRFVALNPVRAGLVRRAQDWPWSSARAQLGLAGDTMTEVAATRERVPDPIGSTEFLERLETRYDRPLRPAKR